jgi:hypothetical protein
MRLLTSILLKLDRHNGAMWAFMESRRGFASAVVALLQNSSDRFQAGEFRWRRILRLRAMHRVGMVDFFGLAELISQAARRSFARFTISGVARAWRGRLDTRYRVFQFAEVASRLDIAQARRLLLYLPPGARRAAS